jgi:hypothetical protein
MSRSQEASPFHEVNRAVQQELVNQASALQSPISARAVERPRQSNSRCHPAMDQGAQPQAEG